MPTPQPKDPNRQQGSIFTGNDLFILHIQQSTRKVYLIHIKINLIRISLLCNRPISCLVWTVYCLHFSAYDYVIPAHGKMLAKTDIQIALPDGCYGRVGKCSLLALTFVLFFNKTRCNPVLPTELLGLQWSHDAVTMLQPPPPQRLTIDDSHGLWTAEC